MSDSLRPHGLQHARLPCTSPTPGACSNSCLSSQGCHPTISSSGVPFSSCLQSFTASGSFLMSQFFISGDQSFRASASASVLPMNIQDWFPVGLTGLISLQSKGLSRVSSNTTVQKHWKRPWCWERLKAGGEGDDRGWDGWMVSLTWWTWVWASSGSWWWTGRPGVLQSMRSQRVRHDWVTELNK